MSYLTRLWQCEPAPRRRSPAGRPRSRPARPRGEQSVYPVPLVPIVDHVVPELDVRRAPRLQGDGLHPEVLQAVEDGVEPHVLHPALPVRVDHQPEVLRPPLEVEGQHELALPRLRLADDKETLTRSARGRRGCYGVAVAVRAVGGDGWGVAPVTGCGGGCCGSGGGGGGAGEDELRGVRAAEGPVEPGVVSQLVVDLGKVI